MPDLTLEQLQAMPDRELDAMAARLVMKWKCWTEQSPDVGFAEHPSAECIIYYQHSCTEVYSVLVRRGAGSMEFRPSTDLVAAFELIEARKASGWLFHSLQCWNGWIVNSQEYILPENGGWDPGSGFVQVGPGFVQVPGSERARTETIAAILTTVEGK